MLDCASSASCALTSFPVGTLLLKLGVCSVSPEVSFLLGSLNEGVLLASVRFLLVVDFETFETPGKTPKIFV